MKNSNQFMPLAALGMFLLLLNACKHDDPLPPVSYPDYGMLKPGNYWIYERYTVDSNGNGTATGVYDSCYVEKDTVLFGGNYAKMFRPTAYSNTPEPLYLRDPLHYVLQATNVVMFSSQDFTSTFYAWVLTNATDTIAEISTKMADKDQPFTTPAGTFITSNFQTTYHMHPPYTNEGTNRRLHVRYAENVGIVSETMMFYSSNPNYTELRLVRYHVQ